MNRRSIAFTFALLSLAAGPVAAHDTVGGTPDVTLAVTMMSIAGALFARSLRGTVRP